MDNRPIGFLDSGVGGLTVVRELLRQLPNENIVYIGDSARAPYGPRTADEIARFTWEMVHFLLSKNIKMLVMACNTATAVCLTEIKEKLTIPVLGVILPGATAAIQKSKSGKIGIIGTQATVHSDVYAKTIKAKSPSARVMSLACPDFVPLVEDNKIDNPETLLAVRRSLAPLSGQVDTLILGCTHYPLLREAITVAMGSEVQLIDSGAETVRDISVLLNYFEINNEKRATHAQHRFYTTGNATKFRLIAEKWLERDVEVATADIVRPTLLVATHNPGKIKEFRELFNNSGYSVLSLTDFPDLPNIEETGMTFEENARLKAEKTAQLTGHIVIADDSGLCVDVLGGLPGVWSHRFAGPDPTDEENNAKLLHELASTIAMPERRTAHFHTTLVAARPGQPSLVVEADWPGRIALMPQGDDGFGYDPLFLVGDTDKTAAELSRKEKNRLSHRGQALDKLLAQLPDWLGATSDS